MEITENQKVLHTLKEAAEYFGIGINTLRRLTNKHTSLCIFNGNKRMQTQEHGKVAVES